jgi:hypothetical protein
MLHIQTALLIPCALAMGPVHLTCGGGSGAVVGSNEPTSRPALEASPQRKTKDPGNPHLTPPPEGSPQPELVCHQPELELGDVWQARKQRVAWEVANAGQAPLNIKIVTGGPE